MRIGALTDVHYAEAPPAGTRYSRQSEAKLTEALDQFVRSKADCVIDLGDLIDTGASVDAEKGHLRRIAKTFARFPGPRHCVLGNHGVDRLTKPEFLDIVGQKSSFYSFDAAGYRLVVLDATPPYGVRNAPDVRKLLEECGKVLESSRGTSMAATSRKSAAFGT